MRIIDVGEELNLSPGETAKLTEDKIQELKKNFPDWIPARHPDGTVLVSNFQ